MSLLTNIQSMITAMGATVKDVRLSITGVSTDDSVAVGTKLNTTAGNVVAAINEVKVTADAAAPTDTDSVAEGSTNLYYTDARADARAAVAVAAAVDAAPAALDTLNELAAALGDDENFAATTTAALGLKANIADTFSVAQLGVGIDTHDFVSDWTAAIS